MSSASATTPPPLRSLLALAESEAAINSLEADHATLLIKQRFDAARLDALDEPPAWLEGLITHKRWRQLVYSLLEDNPAASSWPATAADPASGFAAEVSARPELCAARRRHPLPEFVESLSRSSRRTSAARRARSTRCAALAARARCRCCAASALRGRHSSAAAGSGREQAQGIQPGAGACGAVRRGGRVGRRCEAAASDATPDAGRPPRRPTWVGCSRSRWRRARRRPATASAMAARRLQLLARVPRHSRRGQPARRAEQRQCLDGRRAQSARHLPRHARAAERGRWATAGGAAAAAGVARAAAAERLPPGAAVQARRASRSSSS